MKHPLPPFSENGRGDLELPRGWRRKARRTITQFVMNSFDLWVRDFPPPKPGSDHRLLSRWLFNACFYAMGRGLPLDFATARLIAEKVQGRVSRLSVFCMLHVASAARFNSTAF